MKIAHDDLVRAALEILEGAGENPESANIVASILVSADLRGISTHGVNLLRMIVKRAEAGMLSLPTNVSIVSDDKATAVLDGGDGLGQLCAYRAMNLAIEKAKLFGLGMVAMRNTNNVGALGYYVHLAASKGMAGIMMTNGNPSMAPFGGIEPFLGTNPVAFGVPSASGMPVMLDMSSSVVARGKIRMAALKGEKIPFDWALDPEGKPTDDPKKAIDGCLLPMGGPKGSGLAIIVDIFAGILSGARYGRDLKSFHELEGPTGVGAMCIAIDVARFMPLERFAGLVHQYGANIKTCKRRDGVDEILLPGEVELRKEEKARKEGVDVPEQVVEALNTLLAKKGSGLSLKPKG
jgi:LDH2 family malate/lactate/ureidoglycolate dehydrogenase